MISATTTINAIFFVHIATATFTFFLTSIASTTSASALLLLLHPHSSFHYLYFFQPSVLPLIPKFLTLNPSIYPIMIY